MNYMEQIKSKLKENGGIITSKTLRDNKIPTMYLSRLVESGDLIRVARGMYIREDGDYDEYYFLNERYKGVVFSYVSALYLHNFTDIIPQNMEVTVESGFNAHRINENINIHYVSKNIIGIGKTEVETNYGNIVRAYDLERTICDFIDNRKSIETELFGKTINRYVRYKNKDLNKLYGYSKEMKIYDKVKDVLQVVYE